jgi:hypothetical protein
VGQRPCNGPTHKTGECTGDGETDRSPGDILTLYQRRRLAYFSQPRDQLLNARFEVCECLPHAGDVT